MLVEEQIVKKHLPTATEMKEFAARFDSSEWKKLCGKQIFLEKFSYNLTECRTLAEKILSGKI